jgi:hypothetical protein
MFSANTGAAMGQILLNGTANDGNGTLTLTGAPANMDLNLQFCPFFTAAQDPRSICFGVATVHTDATGSSQQNFHFPQAGIFFGVFKIEQPSSHLFVATGYSNDSTVDFHTSIQRASEVRDVDWNGFSVGDDQLTSGSLNIHGTTLNIQLTGAVPSSTYWVFQCPGGEDSGCNGQIAKVTTDVSGNANATFDLTTDFGPTFEWTSATIYFSRQTTSVDNSRVNYVAGFKVQ